MKTAMQELEKLINSKVMDDEQIFGMIKSRVSSLLEKEKQQIIDAYKQGRIDEQTLDFYPEKHSQEYYNQTYQK